ncbi:MAG: CorA family divalent cation transporter [Bacteroidota bacterium]
MIRKIELNHNVFTWVELIEPTLEELNQVAQEYALHPAAVTDSTQPEHLPKFEFIDDEHFFIICRLFEEECDAEADNMVKLSRKLAIFVGPAYLVTICRKSFSQFEQVKTKHAAESNPLNVAMKLVKATLQTFEEPINKLDYEIDFFESRIFLKKRIPDLLKKLYFIKRRIYVFRKLFNLSKEIIERCGQVAKRSPIQQDLRDHYVKYDTVIEELHESISSLMNIYISLSSQKTNEVMRVLTVFSAFFLPLTFIVGVYGMNFQYMPELQHPYGYLGIWGVMLITTILIFRWFRLKGWV